MIENKHTRHARAFEKEFFILAELALKGLEEKFPECYKEMYMYREITWLVKKWKAGEAFETQLGADAIKTLNVGDPLMKTICSIDYGINRREYYRPIIEELDRKAKA